MYRISQLSHQPLKWTQPSILKMEYELRSGDIQVATVVFRSSFGTLATAQSGDGCWTFKRIGFWQNKASIRQCNSEQDVAVFHNNTWSQGGTLVFANGGQYKATSNFWMTNYEFRTLTEETLLRFKYGGAFRPCADVEILPAAVELPEMPILVMFGWYLMLMLHSDSAAAAAAV